MMYLDFQAKDPMFDQRTARCTTSGFFSTKVEIVQHSTKVEILFGTHCETNNESQRQLTSSVRPFVKPLLVRNDLRIVTECAIPTWW